MQIEIIVRDKIARTANKHDFAVCGNSDYTIKFNFDSEWDAYEAKTARFKYNGTYTDVVFNGSECSMPIITNAFRVEIGVYAGELHTTSSAVLPLRKSILCGNETESEVSQEIKENLDNLLKEKIDCPQTANVNDFLAVEETDENGKPTKLKTETPPKAVLYDVTQELTDEEKAQARNNIGVEEQVQADWAQNDVTANNYIKKRPCYDKLELKHQCTEFEEDGFYADLLKQACVRVKSDYYTSPEIPSVGTETKIGDMSVNGYTVTFAGYASEYGSLRIRIKIDYDNAYWQDFKPQDVIIYGYTPVRLPRRYIPPFGIEEESIFNMQGIDNSTGGLCWWSGDLPKNDDNINRTLTYKHIYDVNARNPVNLVTTSDITIVDEPIVKNYFQFTTGAKLFTNNSILNFGNSGSKFAENDFPLLCVATSKYVTGRDGWWETIGYSASGKIYRIHAAAMVGDTLTRIDSNAGLDDIENAINDVYDSPPRSIGYVWAGKTSDGEIEILMSDFELERVLTSDIIVNLGIYDLDESGDSDGGFPNKWLLQSKTAQEYSTDGDLTKITLYFEDCTENLNYALRFTQSGMTLTTEPLYPDVQSDLSELILSGTVETAGNISITADSDGNPLNLKSAICRIVGTYTGAPTSSCVRIVLGDYFAEVFPASASTTTILAQAKYGEIPVVYVDKSTMYWQTEALRTYYMTTSDTRKDGALSYPAPYVTTPIAKLEIKAVQGNCSPDVGLTYELWGVRNRD